MTLMFCRVPSPSFTVTGAFSFLNGKRRRRKKFAHFGQTTTRPGPTRRLARPGVIKGRSNKRPSPPILIKAGRVLVFWGEGEGRKMASVCCKTGGREAAAVSFRGGEWKRGGYREVIWSCADWHILPPRNFVPYVEFG